jgi:competence protein ComEA
MSRLRYALGERLRLRRSSALAALRRRSVRVSAAASRPAVLGVGVVAVVVLVVTGWRVMQDQPRTEPLAGPEAATGSRLGASPGASAAPPGDSGDASGGGGSASGSAAAVVVVDVVGKVRHPGLVRLPPGARVADAIAAAGGALPRTDLTGLNLARVVVDGEQIAVGVPGAVDPAPSGSAHPAGPVNLNQATLEQLEALPGVGPVLGQRILDWRSQHGRFASVEQLREVSGIGPATFARLRDLVTV